MLRVISTAGVPEQLNKRDQISKIVFVFLGSHSHKNLACYEQDGTVNPAGNSLRENTYILNIRGTGKQ